MLTHSNTRSDAHAQVPVATANVAVVIPIPNDPDWTIFSELSEDVQVIVVDDSDGKLSPAPRRNVRYFDYSAQRRIMGHNYDAIPHKSAATRNFGHYLAYREGFEVVVALDYDCRPKAGWLEQHLACLGPQAEAPALAGKWINSIETPGFYARGYPYEYRNPDDSALSETVASGGVKVNMGVWDNVLDLNGIDKLQSSPPAEPGLRGDRNFIALGNIPVCGMNTAFLAELVPAYCFLPDVWVSGAWQLSRHDDIWGGYILKRLMDLRGDLFSFGRPVVEHTRQSNLERVVVIEHYMHLMSSHFYALVEAAIERIGPGGYAEMFAAFTQEFRRALGMCSAPRHYREVFAELALAMERWSRCFK